MQSKDGQALTEDGDPVYRRNPHPQQAYRITMTIENAPGPFEWISATAFYDMTNRDDCAPFDPTLGMSTKAKEDGIAIAFKKINDRDYAATLYADGMMDANYYGKGVCHWRLGGLGIALKATGKKEETEFLPSLSGRELLDSSSRTTFFWSGGYPRDEMDNYPDTGHSAPEQFKKELRDDLFKVTLRSAREKP